MKLELPELEEALEEWISQKELKRKTVAALCQKCRENRKWKGGDCPVCRAKVAQKDGDTRELEVIYDELLLKDRSSKRSR